MATKNLNELDTEDIELINRDIDLNGDCDEIKYSVCEYLKGNFREIDSEAWKYLSERMSWNEQFLDKYKDKVNWEMISGNDDILWTSSMLERFKSLINWDELSESGNQRTFTAYNLETYYNFWNWKSLSSNSNIRFSLELIDQFIDNWDWEKLINNRALEDFFDGYFLKKYNQYIPASISRETYLWDSLLEIRENELMNEMSMT